MHTYIHILFMRTEIMLLEIAPSCKIISNCKSCIALFFSKSIMRSRKKINIVILVIKNNKNNKKK